MTAYDSLGNPTDKIYLFDPEATSTDWLTLVTDAASHALNVAGAAACRSE